ncbi:Gfo/Idh/MocA family protein [Paludisphaera mucosa]|uniref:Gfo/Idh/MocA family oxidoreductase n=1 Tax=Paludisphaera mucosa TaxID=3030827 RepID=A0ABT6F7R2_9BACT|nr:Gfo/Idh/MocA family oxidoreductase [Paludisphaera mucosa]MDG3003615.1 Gfo/Idh/MocA family oxidoreductase [Paludisphaera mucosa]
MKRRTFLGVSAAVSLGGAAPAPLRLGMVGLVHGHAGGFLSRYRDSREVELVGVAEPDQAVAARYIQGLRLDPTRVHSSIEVMFDRAKPEAVVAFTDTADHVAVVAACARRKIPVMMEKPLAVGVEQARAIEKAAAESGIPVLVNYETTWYPSNHAAYALAKTAKALGEIRKVVIHDGHRGPKEIGVQPEFLAWLTDPERNGAGALFDFGCYGANLMTWLMDEARPVAVTAVTQRFKPDVYPHVDDEATIVLEYPEAQAIVQASWNWPFDRKDMEIYGRTGQVLTVAQNRVKVRLEGNAEEIGQASPLPPPQDDFLRYFAAVVRGEVKPSGPSSLGNNLIVVEILDAARRSAATGRTMRLT